MKIVCGSCGAKYSIADEKVQGKVFKIRCKKCSNVIVVKGNEGEADGHATAGEGAAEWYVVIDGDQSGPVSSVEIDSYFMSGRINADTFAWRDGLADWAPISSLTEFAHLMANTAGPEEATQISTGFSGMGDALAQIPPDSDETVNMSAGSDFGAAPAPAADAGFDAGGFDSGADAGGGFGADLGFDSGADAGGMFGSDAGSDFGAQDTVGGGGFSAFGDSNDAFSGSGGAAAVESASTGGDAGGMFASFDSGGGSDDFLGFGDSEASPVGGSNGTSEPSPNSPNLTGQRNENSVLFSLSSLDSVQAVTGPSSDSGNAVGGPITAADAATTEGSGLIDIRALASAHQGMKGAGGAADDNLDPFSAGSMAMPALMPMGSHRSNTPLIIGGVVAGVLLLGLLGAVGYMLTREDPKPQVVEKVIVEKAPEGDDKAAQALEAQAAMRAELDALKAAKDNPKAAGSDEPKPEEGASEKSTKKTTKKASSSTKPKTTTKKKKKDDIDSILDKVGGKETESSAAPSPKPKKKTTKSGLSKKDVGGTIKRYAGRVNTCYKKQNSNNLSGTLKVKFAIKPNGKVTNAQIKTGKFAGTDVGKCVVKAVKGMKFPSFDGSNIPVTYPFKLK